VMQYVGDAVMAVFGAPFPQDDHITRAACAAVAMHRRQAVLDEAWRTDALEPFGLGIGLSTGEVAAALLGSEERLEYTIVGDIVNLAHSLQDLARPAGTTVVSQATADGLSTGWLLDILGAQHVKGRDAPVVAYKLDRTHGAA
jgi:adenylate cyclase